MEVYGGLPMKRKSKPYTIPVYKLQLVQEGCVESSPAATPAELAVQLKDIAAADREHMVCVFLDTKNRPVGRHVVSIGTLDASIISPRDLYKAAILANAKSVILVHNHPGGDIVPSKQDDDVTWLVAQAGFVLGVPLLDHLILAPDGSFFSYNDSRPEPLTGGLHP
jgi:DNA repair protein RadC